MNTHIEKNYLDGRGVFVVNTQITVGKFSELMQLVGIDSLPVRFEGGM